MNSEKQRLAAAGLASTGERQTPCCYAVRDMFWVERWEIYTVLADAQVSAPTKKRGIDAAVSTRAERSE